MTSSNMTFLNNMPNNQGRGVMGGNAGPGGAGLGTGGPFENISNLTLGPGRDSNTTTTKVTTNVVKNMQNPGAQNPFAMTPNQSQFIG